MHYLVQALVLRLAMRLAMMQAQFQMLVSFLACVEAIVKRGRMLCGKCKSLVIVPKPKQGGHTWLIISGMEIHWASH